MPSASVPRLVAAGNPGPLTGSGNNTWLIDGHEPALIDAGVGTPSHLADLQAALGGRSLVRLLATHGHADHVLGRSAIVANWPGVECWKFSGPAGDPLAWRELTDGQLIVAGDRSLAVVATPGHAPDHVCFWDADARALYAGDMVAAGTSVMIPGGQGGNLRQYLASLERLMSLSPAVMYPGHGPVIDRPVALMAEYVAHRLERERQVLSSVEAVGQDVEAIVASIYPQISEGLRPAARSTVEAHLEKLREEGRLPTP